MHGDYNDVLTTFIEASKIENVFTFYSPTNVEIHNISTTSDPHALCIKLKSRISAYIIHTSRERGEVVAGDSSTFHPRRLIFPLRPPNARALGFT